MSVLPRWYTVAVSELDVDGGYLRLRHDPDGGAILEVQQLTRVLGAVLTSRDLERLREWVCAELAPLEAVPSAAPDPAVSPVGVRVTEGE